MVHRGAGVPPGPGRTAARTPAAGSGRHLQVGVGGQPDRAANWVELGTEPVPERGEVEEVPDLHRGVGDPRSLGRDGPAELGGLPNHNVGRPVPAEGEQVGHRPPRVVPAEDVGDHEGVALGGGALLRAKLLEVAQQPGQFRIHARGVVAASREGAEAAGFDGGSEGPGRGEGNLVPSLRQRLGDGHQRMEVA